MSGPAQPHDRFRDLDLLTPDDVCALLKVKKSWLYDAVESGTLDAIRLGRQLRFRPSALDRYLDFLAGKKTRLVDPALRTRYASLTGWRP